MVMIMDDIYFMNEAIKEAFEAEKVGLGSRKYTLEKIDTETSKPK